MWVANRNLTISADDGVNAQLISLALSRGQLIVTRKQGFCITDDTPYLSTAGPATYQNCDSTQGLSIGWEDQYPPQSHASSFKSMVSSMAPTYWKCM